MTRLNATEGGSLLVLYLELTDQNGEDLGRIEIRNLTGTDARWCLYEIGGVNLKLSPNARKRYSKVIRTRLNRDHVEWRDTPEEAGRAGL